MSDEPTRKPRAEDASYVTIPPELRDFVPPKGEEPGKKDPQLVATMAALKALNGGGEQADPFFFNTRGVAMAVERSDGAEGDEAKGAGNAKVHVPAFALPSAGSATAVSAAAEDAEITIEKAPSAAMVLASAGAEPGASPWAAEPAVAMIALRDLPSALMPVARIEPAVVGVKAPVAPVEHEGRIVRVGLAMVVVALLGFAAFQLVPKAKTPELVGAVPVVSGAVSSGGAVAVPTMTAPPVPRLIETATPREIDAGAAPAPSATAIVAPVKVKTSGGADENIYDAAPSPVKTVEVPLPSATVPAAVPTATPKASSGPTPMFERGN